MRTAFAIVVATLGCAVQANACSWESLSPSNLERLLPERFASADTVVRGVVSSLKVSEPDQVARISVLHIFKGSGEMLNVSSSTLMCGYSFKLGEERIFFISNGRVGIATVEPATAWLVTALQAVAGGDKTPNKALQRTRIFPRKS